jgi:hypothetical protein
VHNVLWEVRIAVAVVVHNGLGRESSAKLNF